MVVPLRVLVCRAEAMEVFRWNRRPLRVKVLSSLLYHAGLSYRVTACVLRGRRGFSHEAVRLWHRRLRMVFPKPRPRCRRLLAVDETKLKLKGCQFYLWACIDVSLKEILALRVSWTRNTLHAERFLKEALKTCLNKPLVLVDRGPWYPQALSSLGLRWKHVTFGQRNCIERWFGLIKERTERFHNSFPNNASLESVKTYLETYTGWYHTLLRKT